MDPPLITFMDDEWAAPGGGWGAEELASAYPQPAPTILKPATLERLIYAPVQLPGACSCTVCGVGCAVT